MKSFFHAILRTAASVLEVPVAVVLTLFIAFAVFTVGWVLVEYFTERRHMTASIPKLLDSLRSGEDSIPDCIRKSGLLTRQKAALLELTAHPEMTVRVRTSLNDNLLEREQSHYDSLLKLTDLIAKLAPMCGLLGTLIPLGPGIIALGNGDTVTLSASLLTAFDTTIAGLVAAAVCLTVSTVRRRWYNGYMSDLETVADCVLEAENCRTPETEGEA